MNHNDNPLLNKVYSARTDNDRREAYDGWSEQYDRDVLSFGIHLPFVGAAVFARHIPLSINSILDAGCGTGMHTAPLHKMGYGPFIGIDLSEGMLEKARAKGYYQNLHQATLGNTLDFENNFFPVTYCIGTLSPGHAPAKSLDELIRVTRSGGHIVFSLRVDEGEEQTTYTIARQAHQTEGNWELVFQTDPFVSMPEGDPSVLHAIFVYKVTG